MDTHWGRNILKVPKIHPKEQYRNDGLTTLCYVFHESCWNNRGRLILLLIWSSPVTHFCWIIFTPKWLIGEVSFSYQLGFPLLALSGPGVGWLCPLSFWSLPVARWVGVETWQVMTFPLASSSTCWCNFFWKKLHHLAAGACQSRQVRIFSYTKNWKVYLLSNFL